jgi:hypothetical protein
MDLEKKVSPISHEMGRDSILYRDVLGRKKESQALPWKCFFCSWNWMEPDGTDIYIIYIYIIHNIYICSTGVFHGLNIP